MRMAFLQASSTSASRRKHRSGLRLSQVTAPRAPIPATLSVAASFSIWIVILLAWAISTYGGFVQGIFLPTPTAVLMRGIELWRDGTLLSNIWASVVVVLVGFCLSSVIAIPLGLLAGTYRIVQAAIGPVVDFTRYLPVTSFVPLFILWIGIGLEQRAAIIFFGVFFQQIVMVADITRNVPEDLLNASYTLGASRRSVLATVLAPAAAPGIIDTLRITIAWGWTYLVVAELVGASAGLGYMSMRAMRGFQVDTIFLAITIIGLLGLLTDQMFRIARKVFFPWYR